MVEVRLRTIRDPECDELQIILQSIAPIYLDICDRALVGALLPGQNPASGDCVGYNAQEHFSARVRNSKRCNRY